VQLATGAAGFQVSWGFQRVCSAPGCAQLLAAAVGLQDWVMWMSWHARRHALHDTKGVRGC
jgi:hypothetical protein